MDKPQFPERLVLGEGYPWLCGLGKPELPYNQVLLCKKPFGIQPVTLDWDESLWSRKVPKYRLVLERA